MSLVPIGGKLHLAEATPSVDNKYGPYTSLDAAWAAISGEDNVACIGLTVGIQQTATSPIVEYWFKDACAAKTDLVPKLDYEKLVNAPKYNGAIMDKDTNIPEVKTTTWDAKLDKLSSATANNLTKVDNSGVVVDSEFSLETVAEGSSTEPVLIGNAVSYEAQSKSIEQKAQARQNIDASKISVSTTGTATEEVKYITIDNVEKKLAGGGNWGEIQGNLEDQTDLTQTLNGKLGASNIKAGNKIVVTPSGNDVTIAFDATGTSVDWGEIGGYINNQADLTAKTLKYDGIVKEYGTESEAAFPDSPHTGTGTGLSQGYWLCSQYTMTNPGYVTSIEFTASDTPAGIYKWGVFDITPSTTQTGYYDWVKVLTGEVELEEGSLIATLTNPIPVNAGQNISIYVPGNTFGYSSRDNYKALVYIGNPTETSGTGKSGVSRLNLPFKIHTIQYGSLNQQGQIDALNTRVTNCEATVGEQRTLIEERTTKIADVTYQLSATTPGIAGYSPNDFWVNTTQKCTFSGIINKIDVLKNNATTDVELTIATFAYDSAADKMTCTKVDHSNTLVAGQTEVTLLSPYDVNKGDIVAICFNKIAQCAYSAPSGTTSKLFYFVDVNTNMAVGKETTLKVSRGLCMNFKAYGTSYTPLLDLVEAQEIITTNHEGRIENLENELNVECNVNDATKVVLTGSSLTEANYAPHSFLWPDKLNDMVDVNIINNGRSGYNIVTNMTGWNTNATSRYGEVPSRSLKPTYILWCDTANNSAKGPTAHNQYRQMLETVRSLGAKLLMGSEEDYSLSADTYERSQRSFANEAGVPYSPTTRIWRKCFPASRPYKGDVASSHSGFRAISPYFIHKDLMDAIPIYKNVKMFRVRPTYKAGSPAITDLTYDDNFQRVKYWTAISAGGSANATPGSGDNLDNHAYDVSGTTNTGYSAIGEEQKFVTNTGAISFNNFALVEFILDTVNITKGTFKVNASAAPTKVYIANCINSTDTTYAEDYVRTTWDELEFTYADGVITASFVDTARKYELYDKVRIVIEKSGTFTLQNPLFKDYDGNRKVYDESIHYHERKHGTELFGDTTAATGWSTSGTAAVASLPSQIANYTSYNSSTSHMQLNANNDSCTKSVAIAEGDRKYRKVAIRIVAQKFHKILTTRFVNTEIASSPYISTSASDGIKNYDYDYGIMKVVVNDMISRKLLVYPGWCELYFETVLDEACTNIKIQLTNISHVDDSYVNDADPIFIHDVSVQEITD